MYTASLLLSGPEGMVIRAPDTGPRGALWSMRREPRTGSRSRGTAGSASWYGNDFRGSNSSSNAASQQPAEPACRGLDLPTTARGIHACTQVRMCAATGRAMLAGLLSCLSRTRARGACSHPSSAASCVTTWRPPACTRDRRQQFLLQGYGTWPAPPARLRSLAGDGATGSSHESTSRSRRPPT